MGSNPPRNAFSLAGWQFRHHSVRWKRIGPSLIGTPVPTFHSRHCSVSDRWVTSQVELAEQSSGGTTWGYPNHLFFFIMARFHQISTYCTDFSMEKMALKFAKFQRKTIPNRQVFMMSPPVSSQEYIRILFFFLLSHLVYSQIWLNHLVDDLHFSYITKLEKKTPPRSHLVPSTELNKSTWIRHQNRTKRRLVPGGRWILVRTKN